MLNLFNMALCALNFTIYFGTNYGNPLNLFAGIFCGIVILVNTLQMK